MEGENFSLPPRIGTLVPETSLENVTVAIRILAGTLPISESGFRGWIGAEGRDSGWFIIRCLTRF